MQTIASAREWLVIRPATAEQTEIDAERVLEKIDSYLRQRGFHSSVIHETTTSGFDAALRWSNRAVATFTTYTHPDGRLALACDCADASTRIVRVSPRVRTLALDVRQALAGASSSGPMTTTGLTLKSVKGKLLRLWLHWVVRV